METTFNGSLKIHQLAEEDRPREKLLNKGKAALTDAELIAILLGSGTFSISALDLSRQILSHCSNSLEELASLSINDLKKFKGIGEAKAITIVSALELGRRRSGHISAKKPKINSAEDVFKLMKPHLLDLIHEEFWIILLNRANQVIKKVQISSGGVSGTIADPKLIFKIALEHTASAIILIHNHPSGNIKPSEADKKLTKKLRQSGEALEIPVLDHLIFCNNDYFSFADEGWNL